MSEHIRHEEASLVKVGHCGLAHVVVTNPLVSRGLAGIAPDRRLETNKARFLFFNDMCDFHMRGDDRLGGEEYEEAIRYFDELIRVCDEALRFYPNDPKENSFAHLYRGNGWFGRAKANSCINKYNISDTDTALEDFSEAIWLTTSYPEAHRQRGKVWFFIGDYDNAIEDFSEAIHQAPKSYEIFKDRGFAWLAKQRVDLAMKDFDLIVSLQPDSVDALSWLAWLLATHTEDRLRDGSRAVQLAEQACHLSNRTSVGCDSSALEALAGAYAEVGEFDLAEQCLLLVLNHPDYGDKLDPDYWDMTEEIRLQLELYKQRTPYRQHVWPDWISFVDR